MGGKTTTATQSVQIPPEVLARYNSVNARAEDVASRPFMPYSNDPNAFVAALTPSQQAGIENINAAAGMSQPSFAAGQNMILGGLSQGAPLVQQGLGQGQALTGNALNIGSQFGSQAEQAIGAGMGPVNAEQFSGSQIDKYMSPYMKNVVEAQQALQQQEAEQQRSALNTQAIMSGAFGGDRGGIAQANLARQQSLANQSTLANLLQGGYGQALGAFQQQQGVNLQAGQANRAAMQNAANQLSALGQQQYAQSLGAGQNLYNMGAGAGQALYGMGTGAGQAYAGLGSQAEQAALNAAQTQMAAGQIQQQTDQAGKTAMYNQFLQQQGFPYQQAQFLANIAMGTGALSGNTTTTQQPGGWSDRRLKENIRKVGETYDGQDIYAYNLKGEKRTQLGLMAQDVEKHTPEAVGLSRGYKTLDYKKATDDAAKRGHFADGGLVPSSMGGAVYEPGEFARGGFADGGYASTDYEKLANGNYLAPDSSVLTPQQYQSQYGAAAMQTGPTPAQQVAQFYKNNLGRTGTADEYGYWTGLMNSRGLSADQIGQEIANSEEGKAWAAKAPTQMPTGVPNKPYQEALTYKPDAFAQRDPVTRNKSGFAAAAPGSSYSSFAPSQNYFSPEKLQELGLQQGQQITPEQYAQSQQYAEVTQRANNLYNQQSMQPQATGKGPSTTGSPPPQATGKGPSTTTPANPVPPPPPPSASGKGPAAAPSTPAVPPPPPRYGSSYQTPANSAGGSMVGYGAQPQAAPPQATGKGPAPTQSQQQIPSAVMSQYNAVNQTATPVGQSQQPINMAMGTGSMGGGSGSSMVGYGKGPATVGYPGSSAQGGQAAPQATGKGPSSGGGGGWASGGRISRATGGAALLEQLAARHLAQYGQMAGGPGTEAHSRIKHSIQMPSAEAQRRFSPGSLPARPQSGMKTAADMGTQLANLYKTGKELRTDVKKLFEEDPNKKQVGGGETIKTTTPGGSAPTARASLDQPNMDESVRGATGRAFGMGNEGSGLAPAGDMVADLRPEESLEALGGLGGGGDLLSAFAARGGRINRDAGGRIGYRAGGLPSGLVQGKGIEIPDDPSTYKLGEGLTKPSGMGGGGGGGNALGTALTLASLATKALPAIASISDSRVKHHKEPIGELFDGQKVYRYDFGDGRTEIGLMAQEVEKHHPEAVRTVDGIKMVDYDKAVSRVKKQIGGGLGDIPVLEEDRRATDEADLNDRRVRLAALQRSETMSDAEPTGLVAGARVASASPTAPTPAAAPAAAPTPATADAPIERTEPRPPVPPASIVDRATEVTRNIPMGPVEKVGEKLGVPELMRDERVFVPLIAGLGAMLASDKPRFSQALGEGLAGAAGAYGAVRGQTEELAESRGRQALTQAQVTRARFVPVGDKVFLTYRDENDNEKFMDLGEAFDRMEKGTLPRLEPAVMEDLRQRAQAAGRGTSPGPVTGDPGKVAPKVDGVTPEGDKAPTDRKEIPLPPGVEYDDQSTTQARDDRRRYLRVGQTQGVTMLAPEYLKNTRTGADSAREDLRQFKELAGILSKAGNVTGIGVAGTTFNERAALIGAANTFIKALGGRGDLGDSAEITKQLSDKITTLAGAARAREGGQESYAALERLSGAIANPSMSKDAYSKLVSEVMTMQRRVLDRASHANRFAKDSDNVMQGAPSDFERLHPMAIYDKEAKAIQRLMTDPERPELFPALVSGKWPSGRPVTAAQIEKIGKEEGLRPGFSLYFKGGQ